MDKIKEAKHFADLLSSSRVEGGKSQEYMALALGVSKNTVYNWEKGTSAPNLRQLISWFGELGSNPSPYILSMIYPDKINPSSNPSDARDAMHSFIDAMPDHIIDQLYFIFMGKHGSSIVSLVQMIVAHLHTDMRSRVTAARTIKENYDMCELRGELVCVDDISPDMDILENSIMLGKTAAMNGVSGYTVK